MKICFVSGNISRSGGTERVATLIANELARRGYDVDFLSVWPGNTSYFALNEGIKINVAMSTKIKKILYNLPGFGAHFIKRIVVKNQYDLVICVDTALMTLVSAACESAKIRLWAWEHFNYEHSLTDPKRMNALELVKKCADRMVVLTKADYDMHLEKAKIPFEKMAQIYNPVSFVPEEKSDMHNKRVIVVGRLTVQKGLDRLLKIWNIVEPQCPDWTMELLGSGELEESLKVECEELGLKNVIFSPKTQNVVEHYKNASIYAMTSIYEGFPMVLLEATTMGLPLIAFDCKTGPSEIINDGENGYLVNDGDLNEYASRLIELMRDEDLRDRMSDASFNSSKRFTLEAIGDKWVELIEK